MAVRFIIGRAGTGKTHHCLERIRQRLREDPINGPRLVLLVPEQAALQMERAILQTPDIAAAHRAEVLSFRRLSLKILEAAGAPPRQALSESARVMVLHHLAAGLAGRLKYYRRVERFGGLIGQLGVTIAELIQEAIEPEQLAVPASSVEGTNNAQAAKLHDLRLIYAAYLKYLGDSRLDPSQQLEVAREHLPRAGRLQDSQVWVDGFASFSGQEMRTLVALAAYCRDIDITLLADRASLSATRAPGSAGQPGALFRKTGRTYRDLHRTLTAAGVQVEEPRILEPPAPPRFTASKGLARLEDYLAGARPAHPAGPADGVELVELPNQRAEANYAVARVHDWVRRGKMRYRDVAVIVRDLGNYHDLLREAFESRNIPCFVDQRRPIAHHPLVELLRAAGAMAEHDLSLDSVRIALKTSLVDLAPDAADELENYLVAHGIEGLEAWRGDWTFLTRSSFTAEDKKEELSETETAYLQRVNETRRKLLQSLNPWLDFASRPEKHDGPAWANAIRSWLDRLNVAGLLKEWAELAESDGDVDQANEHEQVLRDVASFLDDLAFAFSETLLSTQELARVLDTGLAGLTLGLAPPMIDQVLIGSIERSRHPEIRAALIIGFNDGVFPRSATEGPILNDDDRTLLRGNGVRVTGPTRERLLDETLLAYVAVTRAAETCVLTYSTTDSDGKELRPSPYVATLREALPGLSSKAVSTGDQSREMWDILTMRDLAGRLVSEFRSRPSRDMDAPDTRTRWNGLYDRVRGRISEEPGFCRALSSLGQPSGAALSPRSIERLLAGPFRTSVSQLETYATCPFQYFAKYMLRLRERAEAVLAPVDVGQVHHAILEDLVRNLTGRHQALGGLSEEELLSNLTESCHRVALRLPDRGVLSNARQTYELRRSAARIGRILRAQRDISRAGVSKPRSAELPFGVEAPGSLPAVELSTPAGRRVFLRGYIDRVDLAEVGDELLGVVIDYKRTVDKRLKLAEVYHGLSLQLPAYLLALAERGETLAGRPIRPIAALYVSLTPTYDVVDGPESTDSPDALLSGVARPRGLVNIDGLSALDSSAGTGRSEFFSVYVKKDGSLGHVDSGDGADAESFQAVLDHTRLKLGELADGILDGCITVKPYRLGTFSPCSWCTMSGVCHFEMGLSDVRFLESLKRSEIFRILTREPGKTKKKPNGNPA